MRLPNILHESVPVGKDDTENVEIRCVGTQREFDFELKNHGQLAAEQGWADFERATKISGAGFYFLKGSLVLLDMALQRFSIDLLVHKGYTPIIPPYMINRSSYEGVTDLDDFEKVMYKIDGDDMYLIATSEHPIGAMHQDEIFEEKDLPLRLAGISPCFRREIGAHGLDTKGLFRVHQFTKVEQFVFCRPEDSWQIHEELLANAEEVFQKLGIPYRVVSISVPEISERLQRKNMILKHGCPARTHTRKLCPARTVPPTRQSGSISRCGTRVILNQSSMFIPSIQQRLPLHG